MSEPKASSAVVSSELVLLRQRLEKMSEDEGRKQDECAVREEYGQAQYHKGCCHAYALASLRVENKWSSRTKKLTYSRSAATVERKTNERTTRNSERAKRGGC